MIGNETNNQIGQLHKDERAYLYKLVTEIKPDVSIECGTWKGGGSTFYISSAIHENGKGRLFTWEFDQDLHNIAKQFFANRPQKNVVMFFRDDFLTGFRGYDTGKVDFAFLDGPEDAEFTLNALKLVEGRANDKCDVTLHDWKIEKMRLVKEYLKDTPTWEIVTEMTHTITGFCHIRKK